jgi:hypothetical protein
MTNRGEEEDVVLPHNMNNTKKRKRRTKRRRIPFPTFPEMRIRLTTTMIYIIAIITMKKIYHPCRVVIVAFMIPRVSPSVLKRKNGFAMPWSVSAAPISFMVPS